MLVAGRLGLHMALKVETLAVTTGKDKNSIKCEIT